MRAYEQMSRDELLTLKKDLEMQYNNIKKQSLNLNMARGKPDLYQLKASLDMLNTITSKTNFGDLMEYCTYGIIDGIDEAKKFFGELLETDLEHIIVYGNSSLSAMSSQISRGFTHGYMGNAPWCQLDKIKFLCPVPGYDRHFAITEYYGFELINIPMDENGPDMDLVEHYVNDDESVKGIWCVPQYSNPSGITYSDETVERFAHLKPAAKDFRIFWDHAYLVHHLYDDKQDHVVDILKACEAANNPDIVFEFCSTSKMTFPGSGVAAMATSIKNKEDILKDMSLQTIGYDKINQLRHIQYLKNAEGLKQHMRKHADLLRPKFETVLDIFNQELSHLGIGKWTKPLGGYFISFHALNHCAKDIVLMCKEAGVVLTSAGATYPYGQDPDDSNIRIAPSYPSLEELKQATYLFTLCVKLVCIEHILKTK